MGGGGGGGSSQFTAQGAPPNFDYQSGMGMQQAAIGGDIQGYAPSDQDFANRYPALQQAYQNYQANLNQQGTQVAQGQTGQSDLMSQLANQITGRNQAGTTSDIGNIQNAAATAAQATQPIYNLGASQAGLAQPLVDMGNQQAGLANPLMNLAGSQQGMARQQQGIGSQINRTGQAVTGMAATPYAVGQQLLNEPIDPNTQQQMMRAGLTSAAGSLGAASLGSGMAGQAAAARQLGLNTLQYGQAMRGEAMADIGQAASIAGQGGQLQGLGGQTINAAGQTSGLAAQTTGLAGQQIAQGAQTIGLGGTQMNQAAQTYGLGAQTAGVAGGLSGAAQQAQETYGMDTAQMAQIYGGMQSQQAMNQLGGLQATGSLFAKRPFGLGGSNMAQAELGQAGAYNSFQQANYATMNGIAYNGAQMNAQQQQLQAQQNAGMVSAGVGAAGAAASAAAAAAAISCWVARECLPERWKEFRIWMLNFSGSSFRSTYLRHGRAFAAHVSTRPALKARVRGLMLAILDTRTSLLTPGITLLTAPTRKEPRRRSSCRPVPSLSRKSFRPSVRHLPEQLRNRPAWTARTAAGLHLCFARSPETVLDSPRRERDRSRALFTLRAEPHSGRDRVRGSRTSNRRLAS